MKDRKFVESVWEWARVRFSEPHEGYAQGVYVVEGPGWKFSDKVLETTAWSAAAEFTRDRIEEIRQRREEIAIVRLSYQTCFNIGKARQFGDATRAQMNVEAFVWQRILGRLEAELARLSVGIKPEALEGQGPQ